MKRILLTLSYDGTDYHGWQIQPNGITVQQVLCDSLKTLLGVETAVTGCSRTDAGVHANEFCCHIDCADNIPHNAFLKGLNSILPNDIVVKSSKEVAADFHARYSAKGKEYVYRTFNEKDANPFYLRYALPLRRELSFDKVNHFCKSIVGKHDFAPFSASARTVEDTVRTVYDCKLVKEGNFSNFYISADGFLYNMVRIIVGTAIDVSDGRLSENCAEEIFASNKRDSAGKTAPAKGLFLNKIFYSKGAF